MARRVMHELHLKRIAAVDRPCQEGALSAIHKAAPAVLPPEVEAYLKRDFTTEQRDKDAKAGVAMPGGGFPIENRKDLKNAVLAYGRAKDKSKAKAHIVTRARALDATSLLPADWKVSKLTLLSSVTNDEAIKGFEPEVIGFLDEMAKAGFGEDQAGETAREYANDLVEKVDAMVCALADVGDEIEADGTIANKSEALQESVAQFKAHITGIIPEGVANGLVAKALTEAGFEITEGAALSKSGDDTMGFELKKFLGLPATATDADVQKALEARDASAEFGTNVAKMSAEHIAYMQKGENLPEGGAAIFAKMTPAQRDEVLKKFPPAMSDKEKADAEAKEKAAKKAAEDAAVLAKAGEETLTVGGEVILKSVVGASVFGVLKAQAATAKAQDEAIAKLRDKDETTVISKRVSVLKNLGNPDEAATLIYGIQKVAPDLAKAVEAKFTQLDAMIVKGALFDEKGAQSHVMGKAADSIEKQAADLVQKGQAKSIYKARDMVRKAQPELAKQEEAERAEARKAA